MIVNQGTKHLRCNARDRRPAYATLLHTYLPSVRSPRILYLRLSRSVLLDNVVVLGRSSGEVKFRRVCLPALRLLSVDDAFA